MEADDTLGKIKEKIFREYYHTGGVDFATGYVFLCVAFSIALWPGLYWPQILTVAVLFLLVILLAKLWKQRIIYARLGYVQSIPKPFTFSFSRGWYGRFLRFFLLILLVNIAFHYAWKLPMRLAHIPSADRVAWPPFEHGEFIPFISACFVVWGLSGAKFSWPVLLFALSSVALSSILHINVGWAICLTGFLLLGVGGSRLRRFLREHPRLEETDAS